MAERLAGWVWVGAAVLAAVAGIVARDGDTRYFSDLATALAWLQREAA